MRREGREQTEIGVIECVGLDDRVVFVWRRVDRFVVEECSSVDSTSVDAAKLQSAPQAPEIASSLDASALSVTAPSS
ncbi:MAG: hypothetical protein R3A47_11680 [Polyangiales bacterium]